MAHVRQNVKTGEPVFGSSTGSRGAVYYHTTDGDGVISCTCPDFMSGKTAKGTAVTDRVCKHLRMILAGDYSIFTPQAKAGSARALADEIKDELAAVEKELATPLVYGHANRLVKALENFSRIEAKAQAFTDKLHDEIEEIAKRVEAAKQAAQEKL